MTRTRAISERSLLFLIGAVQFVNILDFMMVMPLGPDFASALGIPTSQLGLIGGSYTAAAAVTGLLGAFFLDRFDRRSALACCMVGLVVGTAAGGFAVGLKSLVGARILAGAFGGPATSLAIAIVSDAFPPERRGRAMGAVMGAFSAASVLGVPAGLELARLGGWRLPFFVVAGLGLMLVAGAYLLLPPMRAHLRASHATATPIVTSLAGTMVQGVPVGAPVIATGGPARLRDMLRRPVVLFSLATTFTALCGAFALVPNLSAFLQFNAGYPRPRLGLLYLVGGSFSFFIMRFTGKMVDRFGSSRVSGGATLVLLANLALGFLPPTPLIPVMMFFVVFMGAQSVRGVAMNTLSTHVPTRSERARFQSLQSSVQHMASAIGAFLSTRLLSEAPDHRLVGVPRLAAFSMVLFATMPFWQRFVEERLPARN